MPNHECNGRPTTWADIKIEYDPEDAEWGLVVDFQWISEINHCPYCGTPLRAEIGEKASKSSQI
jgi:hypothetical protein